MTTSRVGTNLRRRSESRALPGGTRIGLERAFLALVLGSFLSGGWLSLAAPAPAQRNARPSVRHVVAVENTSTMESRRAATADVVSRMLLQGFNGHARRGDTVELWLVEDQIHTNAFAPFLWDQMVAMDESNTAYRFLRDIKATASKAAIADVVPVVNPTAAGARPTLIYLVSSGFDSLAGTPYDEAVNTIYFSHRDQMRKSKLPFVTVVAAQGGAWVGHGVTPGDRVPYVPSLPPPPKAAEPQTKTLRTNQTVRPPPAPLIYTNKPAPPSVNEIERKIREQSAERARTSAPPRVVVDTPVTPNSVETNRDASVAVGENPAGIDRGNPPAPSNPGSESAAAEVNAAVGSASSAEAPPRPPAVVSVPRSSRSAPSPWGHVVTGILLLAAAVALLFILFRNSRGHGSTSLISESLDRASSAPNASHGLKP